MQTRAVDTGDEKTEH